MNMIMPGTLIRYGSKQAHTAFVSGGHSRHVVLAGGLGDGLMLADFVPVLAKQLDAISWSLVQPLLSSSLSGWGIGSLDEDALELSMLARCLHVELGSQDFVLCGHSTGCQDAVRYMNRSECCDQDVIDPMLCNYPRPIGVILQAPVSDHDWLVQQADTEQRLRLCSEMLQKGQGEDIAFRDDGVPMTARRFHSLAGSDGDDNMFSTSFDRDQLKEVLGVVTVTPTLWLFSGDDEFVSSDTDKESYRRLYEEVLDHPSSRCKIIEGASHSLTGCEDIAVNIMIDFIKSL